MTPGHDALTAMPGDTIYFLNDLNEGESAVVKIAFWQSAPKGGKVWSYELHDGTIVPNDRVERVEKKTIVMRDENATTVGKFDDLDLAMIFIEKSDLPAEIKTAIQCLVDGDIKGLDIAGYLIRNRFNKIKQNEPCDAPSCLAITKEN
jgi:hypothetical protein